MNAPCHVDWNTANQRLLVAEFALLRALLGDGDERACRRVLDKARAALPAPAAIDVVTTQFGLSRFERALLLLAAGVEMDGRLAASCAVASGHRDAPWASFGLALAALPEAHWSALTPVAPLRRERLVDVDPAASLSTARLRIDERVLHYLAGLNYLEPRLDPLVERVAGPGLMTAAHRHLALRLAARLEHDDGRPQPIVLEGDDPRGQRDVAATVAAALEASLYEIACSALPVERAAASALAALWRRDAALLGSALLVRDDVDGESPALVRFLEGVDGLVFVAGRRPATGDLPCERFEIVRPGTAERRTLWRGALAGHAALLAEAVDTLAANYRLGAHRIGELAAALDPGAEPAASLAGLHESCRSAGIDAGALAQRIAARAGWDELVLPQAQRHSLHQIELHVRHRLAVWHDWGFAALSSRGLGLATLFWGDSGTGKTLAAEVLANALQMPLYRIDLSAVVSKYIGETEKNLRQVFDAAESQGAILLFDEADALFGKRSEVRDSHDRYANIEVSYLLQRMEAYQGLAILTTNHKSALDAAFSRRLRFVIHFPFPDRGQREAIWQAVFPPETPLDGIDFARLANLAVAGGTIRNIALGAAFMAADAGTPVTMALLRRAAHLEAAKRDKPFSDAETRGWDEAPGDARRVP
ncbi:MAG: ATP-binding protein [Rhodocyclaceae bacterium]|nr:ATP-binding protein [Rhodocyclaceae bacterium]